jgi:hypothetical protein
LWAAFFSGGGQFPPRGWGRGGCGVGYKGKCQKKTDFWGFNFGQFSKKENANQNIDFWVLILANFQRRKIKINKIKFLGVLIVRF